MKLSNILFLIQEDLLPYLDDQVKSWQDNYYEDFDPDEYFEDLKRALDGLQRRI